MKPVLTRAQMRAFDREAIDQCHVPGLLLMENAGRGAASVVASYARESAALGRTGPVVIVCGTGNNGGDGFVVARHLLSSGFEVRVWLIGRGEATKGDARINRDAWLGIGGAYAEIPNTASDSEIAAFVEDLGRAGLIVDALLGTGLDRSVEGVLARVVASINEVPAHKVAIDLPSGMDADTGCALGSVIKADATVTFAHLKAGLLTPQGSLYAGRVHVVDLGVPATLFERVGQLAYVIDSAAVAEYIQPRPATSHKHAAGGVLVMAGSPGKIGAALLVGRAALRSGAGLVTIASWPVAIDQIESRVVELMTVRLDPGDLERSVMQATDGQRVVVAGPGFGTDEAARVALDVLVRQVACIKVLDADALTAFAGRAELLAKASGSVVITPHSGEAARLLGKSSADIERDRFGAARELVDRTQAVVILKGAHSIVSSTSGTYVNTSGNPALATAGAGDTLAGIVAGLACSLPPIHAACAGVYVHGRTADLWRDSQRGADRGLLAGELADRVPEVLAGLTASKPLCCRADTGK